MSNGKVQLQWLMAYCFTEKNKIDTPIVGVIVRIVCPTWTKDLKLLFYLLLMNAHIVSVVGRLAKEKVWVQDSLPG